MSVPNEEILLEKEIAHKKRISRRTDLIRAGIEEINTFGIADFSVRRVAEVCGVSCGAPYKHFGNKNGFIAAIVQYINEQWYDIQRQIIEEHPSDLQKQLIESCVRYVRFLVENPHFRSIIMLKDDKFDSSYKTMRAKLSLQTRRLIAHYCKQVGMDEKTLQRKQYVLRSLVYGGALMFDNGEMIYNEETMGFVRDSITREFFLP